MNETTTQTEIDSLIQQLADKDGVARMKAREQLVKIGGHDVTSALVIELNDPRRDIRWEAAKALISIADPIAAPALTHHLQDEDGDIRWLAAEGIAELKEPGLLATLNASIRHAGDSEFSQAVHHAFKEFQSLGTHGDLLQPVIEACESSEPGVSLPVAAYKVLEQIRLK